MDADGMRMACGVFSGFDTLPFDDSADGVISFSVQNLMIPDGWVSAG